MRCCATNKGSQRPLTHCRRPRQFAPAVRDNAIDYSPERLAQGAACVQVARHSKRYSAAGAGQGRGAVAPRLLFARPTDVQVLRPGRVRRGGLVAKARRRTGSALVCPAEYRWACRIRRLMLLP